MSMTITRQDDGDITIFVLEGRVDSDNAPLLEETLQRAVAGGNIKIILEMTEVRYINSAGLRILAEALHESRERGGEVRLVGISDRVRRVFEIIGFNKFFDDYPSVIAAMAGW